MNELIVSESRFLPNVANYGMTGNVGKVEGEKEELQVSFEKIYLK